MQTLRANHLSATNERTGKSHFAACSLAVFLFLLASIGLAGCAGYTSAASNTNAGNSVGNSGGGTLTASPSSIAFGNVNVGSAATQSVTVTNTGTGTVNISGATVSGGVFTVIGGNPSNSLAPGQTATVQLQFAPTSMNSASGALTVASDASNPTLAVSLSGTGLQAVPAFSATSLNFNNVTVGQTSTQNVTLSNTGNMNLSVSAATVAGAGFNISGLALPATIAPNSATTFSVQFAPQSTSGASGSIQFTDNASNSPQTITLTGSAVVAGSTLGANPGSFNFGNVQVGSSSTQAITLTNSGNAAITIGSVAPSGAGFSATGMSAGQSIAAGATATFSAVFAPSAAGAASGTVTIASTATNSPLVIALSGTGIQAALTASPSSINFGSILVGSTASVNVTLTNSGTASLSISGASAGGTGFSMSALSAQTLAPGATATFTATFAPTTAGGATGSISIASTAPGSPLAIALSGGGTATQPQLSIAPSSVAFGNVNVGSNATQTVTLTNTGNATLNITAATSGGAGYTMNLQPTSIGAGANTTFTVTFTPSAGGSASGNISITSNAPASPATIALSGTGIQAQVAATPSSVAFGTVTVGNTNSQAITLKNNGNTTLTFSQISVTGSGFGQTGLSTSTTIAAGASATFNATFNPSSTGSATGSITLATNGTPSSLAIGLSGTGQTGLSAPTITSATAASGIVGTAFSYQISATNSPTSYAATGLPAGLSVNTSTGLISGTPTAAATSTVTMSATNSAGTGNATLTLTISVPAPVITSATTASGIAGSAFSYQITATNSPTSYGATGLPAGLVINTTTGVVSGTPTATGTSSVTLGATNSGGTGNATLTLTIAIAKPTITSATSASATVGAAFSYQITATNSPTSYGATGLPAGLSINTGTGAISGTPTAAGTSTVTLSATNSTGTGNATLTLTISAPAPVITSATTSSGTVGAVFSYQITATNSPTSYGATGLPAGLSINTSTGAISGTPATTGTSTVTLSATNSTGTGNATLTITIASGAQLSISPSPVAFGNVNVGSNSSKTVTLTNTGGATLNITAAGITGAGYTMTLQPISINAGANTTFTVTFAPTTGGSASGSISITSNAPGSPATIALSGTGLQAQISATPSSVAFGTVTEGITNSVPITLKNGGNTTLTFSQISVTGAGFGQTGLSTSTAIAAGGSTTFNATFDPTSATTVSGSITLTTNGTPSPLVIGLSGTGQAQTLLLGASPTSLAFGNVLNQSSSQLTTSVTNNGNSNVTISSVTAGGTGFAASGILGGTVLTPGQSATLTVTFAPISGGSVSGSVIIASNATNSPATVGLSGTGMHSVVLTWAASPTSGVTYNVFRGTTSGGETTTPVNTSPITLLTFTDTNVTPGGTYYYTVEAVDSAGSSAPSNEASAAIPNP
jgi:Putative Ig domain/Abnormal spindle-like microcephaly-assoc'd, ASPM-SPD-2-Hydin